MLLPFPVVPLVWDSSSALSPALSLSLPSPSLTLRCLSQE
uniref:Uncharacterized protein n=1 Tax=Anguilla anguilla TaxID=7936 RepID=A0A0E9QBG9_ANGAN